MKWLLRCIPLVSFVLVSCTSTTNAPVTYTQNSLAPTIASFSPDTVWTFKTLTIHGTNFGYDASDIRVYIDTSLASVTDVEDTIVRIMVPEGARTGFIHVWAYEQTATSTRPVVVVSTFTPHSINDTISDGGSFSIPGTGMNNFHGHLRLNVGGIYFPIDSVFPDRIVSHAPPNCPSNTMAFIDSTGTYSCGSLTVTRSSRWGTLSEIWDRMTLTETHHRTGYMNGPANGIDSTWTVKVYLDGQRDWDVHGNRFVRTTGGLTYDFPPFRILLDTVKQTAVVSFQQNSSTSTETRTIDTSLYSTGSSLPAPLPVDGEFEFALPYFQYQIQESFTDGHGLVSWQETTTTQVTSGEFDIILKH